MYVPLPLPSLETKQEDWITKIILISSNSNSSTWGLNSKQNTCISYMRSSVLLGNTPLLFLRRTTIATSVTCFQYPHTWRYRWRHFRCFSAHFNARCSLHKPRPVNFVLSVDVSRLAWRYDFAYPFYIIISCFECCVLKLLKFILPIW